MHSALEGAIVSFAVQGLSGQRFQFGVDDFEQAVFGVLAALGGAVEQLIAFGGFQSDRWRTLEGMVRGGIGLNAALVSCAACASLLGGFGGR